MPASSPELKPGAPESVGMSQDVLSRASSILQSEIDTAASVSV